MNTVSFTRVNARIEHCAPPQGGNVKSNLVNVQRAKIERIENEIKEVDLHRDSWMRTGMLSDLRAELKRENDNLREMEEKQCQR